MQRTLLGPAQRQWTVSGMFRTQYNHLSTARTAEELQTEVQLGFTIHVTLVQGGASICVIAIIIIIIKRLLIVYFIGIRTRRRRVIRKLFVVVGKDFLFIRFGLVSHLFVHWITSIGALHLIVFFYFYFCFFFRHFLLSCKLFLFVSNFLLGFLLCEAPCEVHNNEDQAHAEKVVFFE